MIPNLIEIGLAPECVHTGVREKRYYLMKRFVKSAIKVSEEDAEISLKIVAFLYETPFQFLVLVEGNSSFAKVADIFCNPSFSREERLEIFDNLTITSKERIEIECMARGYKMPCSSVFAVINY